jgi:hypothetical protein
MDENAEFNKIKIELIRKTMKNNQLTATSLIMTLFFYLLFALHSNFPLLL